MRLRLDQYIVALLFLCALMIGFCQSGHGQDSTFSRYEKQTVIDSVLFVGDTARFEIYGNWHYGKKQPYLDASHSWSIRGNERICLRCLRWERFHVDDVPVYKYDPYYLAKKRILDLKK